MSEFSSAFSSDFALEGTYNELYVIDPTRSQGGLWVQDPTQAATVVIKGTLLYVMDGARTEGGYWVQDPTVGTAPVTDAVLSTTVTFTGVTLNETLGQAPSISDNLGQATIGLSGAPVNETVGIAPAIFEILRVAKVELTASAQNESITPVDLSAAVTNTLPGLSQSLAGTAQPVFTATGYTLLPNMRQSVTANLQSFYNVTATNTLPSLQQNGTAKLELPSGSISQKLPALTQDVATTVKNTNVIRVAQTLPKPTQTVQSVWSKSFSVYFSGDASMYVNVTYIPKRTKVSWYKNDLIMRS